MTNADYIRSLPDEELVFVVHCLKTCTIPNNDRDCYKCKLDFLKSEHKDYDYLGGKTKGDLP
jgi:hypothetical protein